MMVSSLAALVVLSYSANQAIPDRQITYTCRAKSADLVLADISKQAGIRLAAGPGSTNEYLVIAVKQSKLKDLLSKVAEAAHAEWKWESNRLVLNRTKERNDLLKEREIKAFRALCPQILQDNLMPKYDPAEKNKAEGIVKQLDALADQYRRTADDSQKAAIEKEFFAACDQFPTVEQIIGWSVRRYIDYSKIGYVEPGQTILFSSEPTKNEEPLVVPADRVAAASAAAFYREEAAKHRTGRSSLMSDIEDGKAKVPKLCLAARLTFMQDYLYLWFSDSKYLSGDAPAYNSSCGTQLRTPQNLLGIRCESGRSVKEDFSPLTGRVMNVLGSYTDGPARRTDADPIISEELLSTYPSDMLLRLARINGRNLVADLSDECALLPIELLHFYNSDNAYSYFLDCQIIDQSQKGWLVLKPIRPYTAAAYRVNRKVVSKIVEAFSKSVGMDLPDIVRLSALTTSMNPLERRFLKCLIPCQMNGRSPLTELRSPMVRILACLSPAHQGRLYANETLYAGELSPTELQSVNRELRCPDTALFYEVGPSLHGTMNIGLPSNACLTLTAQSNYFAADPSTFKTLNAINGWLPSEGGFNNFGAMYLGCQAYWTLNFKGQGLRTAYTSLNLRTIDQSRTYKPSEIRALNDRIHEADLIKRGLKKPN